MWHQRSPWRRAGCSAPAWTGLDRMSSSSSNNSSSSKSSSISSRCPPHPELLHFHLIQFISTSFIHSLESSRWKLLDKPTGFIKGQRFRCLCSFLSGSNPLPPLLSNSLSPSASHALESWRMASFCCGRSRASPRPLTPLHNTAVFRNYSASSSSSYFFILSAHLVLKMKMKVLPSSSSLRASSLCRATRWA